jgi:hypothetical protein
MRFLSLRALFLLGFVVAMPVLALPPVARWMDELLYGTPPSDFGRPPVSASPHKEKEVVQPLVAEPVSHAGFAEAGPAAVGKSPGGLEVAGAQPPNLAPLPAFAPLVPPHPVAVELESKIDERTMTQLQEVRRRLEELGAEYVVVETIDGSGQYCFRCRMLVDQQSRFTRSFEASSPDPVVASQQVLRAVETWRSAAAEKPTQVR